ncbi:MAG: acetyl-CoA hydrolase/transferase C-terminal domain-containing protein, partial [Syntrophales bacterium]
MSAENWEKRFPLKYRDAGEALRRIRRGDTIFIATACAEPKFLIDSFLEHASALPEKFRKSLRILRLGISPYAEEKLRGKFRRESFFIDDSIRKSVNRGNAEYNPLFLSQAPRLLRRGLVRVDAALVQASPPDHLGYMSLGISIDVVKAAIEQAGMVIVQANGRMPRVHGDTFIHLDEVDYVIPHDEELIEFSREADTDISRRIGRHVAGLIQDGDTIQVGYGSIPNAILSSLSGKKDLGLHTELMGDEAIALMRSGVINNSRKTINRGKAVATFCMGRRQTYDYLNDNPEFEFRQVDYTNNPLVIAGHDNMVAINTALEIDLTGQTTVESIGKVFYSGTGGQADFMRGAALSRGGRSILALESTTEGGKVSRIVPSLK